MNEAISVKNLYEDLRKCKDLCYQYNNLLPSDDVSKNILLKNLFRKSGKDLLITQPFHCDLGWNIEIGDNFYANHNLIILDGAKVSIGNNVFIGPNCCISTASHPLDAEQRNKGIEYAEPITIGNSVWLGAGVTIVSGVKIGENTVIGAGSIVTKDIPSNVIAFGNPCRVVRKITEKDTYNSEQHQSLSFSKE